MTGARLVRWTIGVAALLMAATLHGCNTMEGIGEDISAAGQSMADVSAKTNPDSN